MSDMRMNKHELEKFQGLTEQLEKMWKVKAKHRSAVCVQRSAAQNPGASRPLVEDLSMKEEDRPQGQVGDVHNICICIHPLIVDLQALFLVCLCQSKLICSAYLAVDMDHRILCCCAHCSPSTPLSIHQRVPLPLSFDPCRVKPVRHKQYCFIRVGLAAGHC